MKPSGSENWRRVAILRPSSDPSQAFVEIKKMTLAITREDADAARFVSTLIGKKLFAVPETKKEVREETNAADVVGIRTGRR
ncbi:hypothetical protein GW17_00031046 [Ensete ventricosum]|nr:hypothetical protein GW17_00031046 [Ensete ventricosum]